MQIHFPVAAVLLLATLTPAASGPPPKLNELLPDLYVLPESLRDQRVTEEGGRRLLRFSTTILNRGTGPVEVRGFRNGKRMPAWQRVQTTPGQGFTPYFIGRFEYHTEHRHWHLLQVAVYRLKDLAGDVVASSDKVSFCLRDSYHIQALPGSPTRAHYLACERSRNAARLLAGISVGWADYYGRTLDGQWVDITEIPAGDYTLEVEVNPAGLIHEADLTNNITAIPVTLPDLPPPPPE